MIAGNTYAQTHILLGTCTRGGSLNAGTIWRADSTGANIHSVYSFDYTNGAYPWGNLVQAANGKIYGTTFLGGCADSCVLFEYDPVTGINLDVFDFECRFHAFPYDGLDVGADGNLYGVCAVWDTISSPEQVLFRFNPNTHVLDSLYTISNSYATRGHVLQINNKLYGMVNPGNIYSFDLTTSTFSIIHTFIINGCMGQYRGLILATDGKLYGMTHTGVQYQRGNIFSLDTVSNTVTMVHNFNDTLGGYPEGRLIQAMDGKLYGMTRFGGTNNIGVIFSYDITNSNYSVIHNFDSINGINPSNNLIQASNGMLYGTTFYGGIYNYGVAFSFDISTNTFTKLIDFDSINGKNPEGDFFEATISTSNVINLNNNPNKITILPNPATTILTIHQTQSTQSTNQLIITDLLGSEVYKETLTGIDNSISISILNNGVYFYEVRGEKQSTRGKFVVQR